MIVCLTELSFAHNRIRSNIRHITRLIKEPLVKSKNIQQRKESGSTNEITISWKTFSSAQYLKYAIKIKYRPKIVGSCLFSFLANFKMRKCKKRMLCKKSLTPFVVHCEERKSDSYTYLETSWIWFSLYVDLYHEFLNWVDSIGHWTFEINRTTLIDIEQHSNNSSSSISISGCSSDSNNENKNEFKKRKMATEK